MDKEHSIEELRKRAHTINCQLFEDDFSPREIEIIGYYLHRIAASYLSFFTHKEYDKNIKPENIIQKQDAYKKI
jgi:hypothetical protein